MDLAKLADMYVRQCTWEEMAKEFGVSMTQIGYDLAKVREEWKKRTALPIEELRTQTVIALKKVEQEAWIAYHKSQEDAVKRIQRETSGGPGGGSSTDETVTEPQCGDPRYLQIIQNAHEQVRKMFGMDAPTGIDVTSGGEKIKAYVAVSPDDWPTDPEKKPDGDGV